MSKFGSLVGQLNPSRYVQTNAMKRGIELEAHAAMVYANSAKGGRVNLFPSGLVSAKISDASLAGKCSCVAGIGGYCHRVIGLLYYLALLKQLGHCCLPDELTCTSMKQRWSVPRGRKIEQKEIQDILVKKPQMGAQYSKFIKSTLYSPATMYRT